MKTENEIKKTQYSELVKEKTWEEFKDTKLLQFVNTILHVFGWSIVLNMVDGKVTYAYPARVKFRGFSEKENTKMYIKLSELMLENAEDLLKEAKE